MPESITVHFYNHVHLQVECSDSIASELQDHFTFLIPNHRYHPLVKKRKWDGRIRLFQPSTRKIYTGLLQHVHAFCNNNGYGVHFNPDSFHVLPRLLGLEEANRLIDSFRLPSFLERRDYQVDTFVHCVNNRRALVLSPTSSGKSLLLYLLSVYYAKKTLIIAPNTGLVHQIASDFQSYGMNPDIIHKIYSGQDKDNPDSLVYVGCWQSLYKLPPSYFEQFNVLIMDEVHHAQAKSLVTLMSMTTTIPHKFGFTGTLDGLQANEWTLEGLFGPTYTATTSRNLIDSGYAADLAIKAVVLKHPAASTKALQKTKKAADAINKEAKTAVISKYRVEVDWLIENEKRNRFIAKLAKSLDGNTLLLFRYVDKHGIPLYNLIKDGGTNTYLVHGEIDGKDRDEIRRIVNTEKKSITVASVQTFGEGINIPNINNIILAFPGKAKIQTLQTLGRGLRKSETKTICNVFDISDDLCFGKDKNYTYLHMLKRLEYYQQEQYPYEVFKIDL